MTTYRDYCIGLVDKLWVIHVSLQREIILSIIFGTPNTAVSRCALMLNNTELTDNITKYYGEKVSNVYDRLLTAQCDMICDIVENKLLQKSKMDNLDPETLEISFRINNLVKELYQNGTEVSTFLGSLIMKVDNKYVEKILHSYLTTILTEIDLIVNGEYLESMELHKISIIKIQQFSNYITTKIMLSM